MRARRTLFVHDALNPPASKGHNGSIVAFDRKAGKEDHGLKFERIVDCGVTTPMNICVCATVKPSAISSSNGRYYHQLSS